MKRRRNPSSAKEDAIRMLVEDAVEDLKLTFAEAVDLHDRMTKLAPHYRDADIRLVMVALDKMLDGRGVGALSDRNAHSRHWGDVVLLYVNTGDPYDKTIVYDTDEGKLLRASWGGWLERYEMTHDADVH